MQPTKWQPTKRAQLTKNKGKQQEAPSPPDANDDHNSEDELMEMELERLRGSSGNVSLLWAAVPEFAGMANATQSYNL